MRYTTQSPTTGIYHMKMSIFQEQKGTNEESKINEEGELGWRSPHAYKDIRRYNESQVTDHRLLLPSQAIW